MGDPKTTILDEADEDILTYTVSDEELQAAGTEWGVVDYSYAGTTYTTTYCAPGCCGGRRTR